MSSLALHPAAVHVPLGLAVVIPLVAIGVAVLAFRRGPSRGRLALVFALQALLVGSGFLAARLGEADEDRVEPVVGEAAIEAHEHRAEAFLWTSALVLVAAGVALGAPRRVQAAGAAGIAAASVLVAGLALWTGEAGGELVYARGAAAAFQAGGVPDAAAVAAERDDD